MKINKGHCLAAAIVLAMAAALPVSAAQLTLTATPGSVNVNALPQTVRVSLQYAAGNSVEGYTSSWEYNPAVFGVPVAVNALGTHAGSLFVLCEVDAGTNTFSVATAALAALGTASDVCQWDIPVLAGTAVNNYVLGVSAAFPPNFTGGAGTAQGVSVGVVATPVPLTLSYAPAAGSTVTFAAGAAAGTAAPAQTIAVTATGTSNSASLTGCGITGAGASSFSVAPSSLTFNAAGAQNLSLGCTYPTSSATATLTCSETDADSAGVARSWNLSCPAPNVAPTVTSVTTSPLAVSSALVGGQGTATIDLSAAGGSGTGSTAVSCTSTGTVVIAAAPGTPAGQGPVAFNVVGTAQPTDIRVGVPLTANAQPAAGTVTCTVAGQPSIVINVTAPAGTTVVAPAFIPSSSTWSTIALLSLLGVFGLLTVGFRRQS